LAEFRRGEEWYEADQAIRPQPCRDRFERRSRSATGSTRPRQQPETAAKAKNFAGRQNCVRSGNSDSSMAHAPEALRHAGDIRPLGLSVHASAHSLARAAKLQPSPAAEIRPAVLSSASSSSLLYARVVARRNGAKHRLIHQTSPKASRITTERMVGERCRATNR
jgi:hypothetical protein